jgi:hypothetical protein
MSGIEETRNLAPDAHKARHIILHAGLDELLADYLTVNGTSGKLPSKLTVLELIAWSHAQTQHPTELTHDQPTAKATALSDADVKEFIDHGLVVEAEAFGASPEFARAMVKAGYRARQCDPGFDGPGCAKCALVADCDNIRDQLGVPSEGCESDRLYWVRIEEVADAGQKEATA